MKQKIMTGLFVTLLSLAFNLNIAVGAGQGVIHGILYISPPGDLSYDVMYGRDVEVWLLKEAGLQAALKALKADRLPQLRAQHQATENARQDFRRARRTDEEQNKLKVWEQEAEALQQLRSAYEKEVDALLATYMLQKTRTDQEGKFRFPNLSSGYYFLHSRFNVLRTHFNYEWLSRVDLQDGEVQEVHLNKPNAVQLYYGP